MASPTLRRRRSWGWLLWLVLLAAVAYGVRRALANRPRPALAVRVHRVQRGRVRDLVSTVAAGRVAARREATLRAELAGTVLERRHRRGDRVTAGEVLLRYDTRDLQDRVAVTEAAVALGRAQAQQAEASARVANTSAARVTRLHALSVSTPAELETAQGQLDVAQRAASTARVGIAQALANVRTARDALARSTLRAPFAGTLLTHSIEEGEVTSPAQPLFTLADTTELHVDGELDEADLGRVQTGLPAEVNLDAFPSQRFTGTLTELAPSVTRDLRGNRSISIRVTLSADPRLRVGMSADVDVIVATRESVVWVPPNAILGRGTDRAVMVVDGEVARRRAVTLGVSTWEASEVVRGLREGERVITTLSSAELVDGVRIRVDGESSEAATRSSGAGH